MGRKLSEVLKKLPTSRQGTIETLAQKKLLSLAAKKNPMTKIAEKVTKGKRQSQPHDR